MRKVIRIRYDPVTRRRFLQGVAGAALVVELGWLGCDDPGPVGDDDTTAPPDDDDSAAAEIPRARIAEGPTEVAAGTVGTWTIEVEVGSAGLRTGDGLAICVEHGADWHGEYDDYGNPVDRLGGVSVEAAPITFEILSGTFTSGGNAAELRVTDGELAAGETVRITVGDGEVGNHLTAPTMVHDAAILVFEHADGELTEDGFRLYRELLPAPTVTITALEPAALGVLARSHAAAGESLSVVLRVEDELGNVTPGFEGDVALFDDAGDTQLWSGAFSAVDEGVLRIEGAVLDDPGIYRLRAELTGTSIVGYGGPIEVGGENPARWGQIHGHSLASDGLGTPTEWYAYARDVSNLDFASLTDHGYLTERVMDPQFFRHDIFEEDWDDYASATRDAHVPGSFVTFLAYEWTSNLFSDKNVYLLDDDAEWEAYPETLDELYDRYRDRSDRVTIVSHMMWATTFMRATDWDTFDADLERVVEVASVHGVREYAGNPYWVESDVWAQTNAAAMQGHLVIDGLLAGHRLGLVCGDDSHQGFPGNSHRGRHQCRCTGLMAVRTAGLTREALWNAWRSRRVWGSTGPRVLLDFQCCGVGMGEEVVWPAGEPRPMQVRVHAPRPVTRIEIVRNDPEAPVYVEDLVEPSWNPPELDWTDTAPPEGEAFYYVRVFVEGDDLVWSSPVWVVTT